jgi:hypothetical protein
MTENTPIDDRAANIQQTVLHIITTKQDEMFDAFDRLHRRGINDDDVVAALRHFGETDLLDQYAEWADIDLREDDNTTTSPDGVTDPGDSDTNKLIEESHQTGVVTALIVEALGRMRDTVWEPYVDVKDTTDAVIDGHIDLTAVARHIVKGLGK